MGRKYMPYMWSDKNLKGKLKDSNKRMIKEHIPIMIILGAAFYYLIEKITLVDLLTLSVISTVWLFSTIDMFRQPSHLRIPDTYTKEGKTLMFVVMWLIVSVGFLFIGKYIFDKYNLFT